MVEGHSTGLWASATDAGDTVMSLEQIVALVLIVVFFSALIVHRTRQERAKKRPQPGASSPPGR